MKRTRGTNKRLKSEYVGGKQRERRLDGMDSAVYGCVRDPLSSLSSPAVRMI